MSISIAADLDAPLTITNFFPTDVAHPITLAMYVKPTGLIAGGFMVRSCVHLMSTDLVTKMRLDFFRDGTITNGMFAQAENATNINTQSQINLHPDFEAAWRPAVYVYNPSGGGTLYSRNAAGTTVSASVAAGRGATNLRDLVLFAGADPVATLASHLAVYKAAMTLAQVEEYFDTANVATLTPYSHWDATADWGAGTITDSGSSGQHLTVPAGWSYSADNPSLSPALPVLADLDGGTTYAPAASVVLNGANFATTGGTVSINGVSQTVTNQTTTAVTFTSVRGGNPYDTDLTLTYDDGVGGTGTLTVQQVAGAGEFAVEALNPNTTDESSLWFGLVDTVTGDPVTIVDGDQALLKDPNGLGNLSATPEGVIYADTEGDFTVQIWLASEGIWGADQTVTFGVVVDSAPDPFTVAALVDQPLATNVEFAPVTVSGVDAGLDIAVSVTGTDVQYAVDSGAGYGGYTSTPTNVQLGYSVRARILTSSSNNTEKTGTLSIGSESSTLSATTEMLIPEYGAGALLAYSPKGPARSGRPPTV